MTARRTGTTEERPFDILGINEEEERVYRWLLANSGASLPEIAQALALTPGKSQRLLDTIESKGLTTHTPERPRRYVPASPDISIEALILQHQNNLQRARRAMRELQEKVLEVRQHDDREQMVELITNREAEHQIVEQITRTARHEIVALVRPPLRVSRLETKPELEHATQRAAQARGVCSRSIVDSEFLAMPGALDMVRSDIRAGEQIKMFPRLPFKMVLADHRIALIPLNLQQPHSPSLLVRSSALLDALYVLFDILWERSAPISFTRSDRIETNLPDAMLQQEIEDLISLLAAGLNDKKVADRLAISDRTLRTCP